MRLADILSSDQEDDDIPSEWKLTDAPTGSPTSDNGAMAAMSEAQKKLSLIHEKGCPVTVADIVEAAKTDSFFSYLKAHNLDYNENCKQEFTKYRDLRTLRTSKLMRRPAYATVSRYLLVAQFYEYLKLIPQPNPEIDLMVLKLTDARELASKLCFDLGTPPRMMAELLLAAQSKTAHERLVALGGTKLQGPPSWCLNKTEWDDTASKVREAYYAKGTAQRRRRARAYSSDNEDLRRPQKICWVYTTPQTFPSNP